MAEHHRLSDVYGIARDLPLNYEPRKSVDMAFVESLTRDKHIVVYGSSKQGKTSLRKYNLKDDEYIVVTSSNRWTSLASLHTSILKAAGYTGWSRARSGRRRARSRSPAKGSRASRHPLFAKGKAGGEGSAEGKRGKQTTTAPLELDPGDVNDIIAALKQIDFDKFIVLEDFHYLPDDTQRDFAVALKAFHEGSDLSFIVVGVWLDQNRLIQHNGDLTGRVIAVNADAWSADELTAVIEKGEKLLNITFDARFKVGLVAAARVRVRRPGGVPPRMRCGRDRRHADQQRVIGEDVDPAIVIRDVITAR